MERRAAAVQAAIRKIGNGDEAGSSVAQRKQALEAMAEDVSRNIRAAENALNNDPEYISEEKSKISAVPQKERIEKYLDPSYKLSKLEQKDARDIAKSLVDESNKYYAKRGATAEQREEASMKRYYAQLLISKTSNLQAVGAGVLDAIPLFKEGVDKLSGWANEKLYPGEDLPTAADVFQNAQTQSPIAYTGGNIGGNLALYSAGSAVARGIPAFQKIGQAAAATPVAQAVQKLPAVGRLGTADALAGIVGDTSVDLVLDTAPLLFNDVYKYARQQETVNRGLDEGLTKEEIAPMVEEYYGEYLTPGSIAGDIAKNVGTNLAFNLGGEILPDLVKAGGSKLKNAFNPPPSLYDYVDDAAKAAGGVGDAAQATGKTAPFSLNDFDTPASSAANDIPLPTLENAVQAAQGGADDVVNAWRSGTLTNAQLDTLKPGGVNRAAFEQATGVKLPDTSSETRKFLRSIDNQQAQVYDEINNMAQGGALNVGERDSVLAGRPGIRDSYQDVAIGGAQSRGNSDVPERTGLTFSAREKLNQAGITDFGMTETRDHQSFIDALEAAKASNKNGASVDSKTLDELQGAVAFMSKDGMAGGAVEANGNITAVFKNANSKGKHAGIDIAFQAVAHGGDRLDCYGSFLANTYSQAGFEPVAKVSYAWGINPAMDAQVERQMAEGIITKPPDIYFMKLRDGATAESAADDLAARASKWYSQEELDALPTMDYDEALAYRDSLIEAGRGAGGSTLPPESIGAMRHNPRSYAGMQVEYGTIAPGENAARVVDVPISTNGTDRVSASARTFMEAPQTTDELVGMFEKGVEDGLFSHDVKRDADSLARAVSAVEQDGYQNILTSWKNLMRTGASPNKEQIIQGQLLYTLAAKNGDTATAMELAGDLARIATESGQNLQAQRLLKRMTPEGKLYYAQQTVDSFNRQLKQQLGDGFQDIKIPEELARPLMEAKDAKAQNDAMQNIYQYVADQLPADWGTRWNAWRYLSMLSNPATHIRNVLSNAVNIPARKFKNLIGAAIESHYVKKGKLDPSQRTKALLGNSESDKALKAFAKKDLDNVMGDLTGAKKYSDKGEILSRIDPFKINGQWGKTDTSSAVARGARAAADKATGALSWLYRANSNALSAEDMLFKRSAYVDSLAGYLKAQGIDPAKATQKQLDAAREYAVEEALRATYTEYNKLAETLSMIEKRHPVGKVFLGGAVPFKSTPLNIIRRGVNYSPAGLVMNTVTGFINLKNGKITASQFIDNISQGLSGTAIFLLGTWFGMNGYINSVGPENRKEQTLKSGQGVQSYSFNLPWGGTYTIDWAGPSAMALLAGAQLGKEFENEDLSFDDVVNAALNVIEPAFDTTMLSGINSAIQSATYAGNNPVVSAGTQMFSNFFTQGVPSISGAVARAYDPVRRTAYSESDGVVGKFKENVQRMQNKIPGQSTQNQPYIDVWGREQENPGGSFVGRLAYNMLSPGYYSPDRRTVADDVVEGLYQQTGDTGMLPGLFSNSVTVDGEKIRLSPDDYTLAKQTKGQASNQMIESLYDYPQYNMADTEVQADVVKGVYDLANDVAKYQVVPSLYDELVSDIESGDASKSEMLAAMYLTGGAEQVIPYLVADELTSDVRADKNAKGNSIPGSREKNFIETLMQNGYTRGDAEALYQLLK